MKTSQNWSRMLLGCATLVWLAGAAAAQQSGRNTEEQTQERTQRTDQQAEESQDRDAAAEEEDASTEKANRRVLAIVQLEHCKAQDVQQLLNFDAQYAAQARAARNASQEHQVGSAYDARPAEADVRVAATDESDVLFLRGPENEVKRVQQLIKTFDVPPGELKRQKLDHMHVIPVRSENSSQIQSVLAQLGLDAQLVQQTGDMHLIIVPVGEGEDEDAREAQQVEEIVSQLNEKKSQSQSQSREAEDAENASDQAPADRAEGAAENSDAGTPSRRDE